jgi:hypothetical protein
VIIEQVNVSTEPSYILENLQNSQLPIVQNVSILDTSLVSKSNASALDDEEEEIKKKL